MRNWIVFLIAGLLLVGCSNPFSTGKQDGDFVEFVGKVTRKGVPLEYVRMEVVIKESMFREDGRGDGSYRLVRGGKTDSRGTYSIKIELRSEPLWSDAKEGKETTNPKCWLGVKVYANAGWKAESRSLNLEREEMSMREFKERLGIPFTNFRNGEWISREEVESWKAWMPIVEKSIETDFKW